MNELHFELQKNVPVLRVKAADISILEKPSEFYNLIIKKIYGSQKEIYLSSLYVGTDALSKKLLQAIEYRMKNTPELKVTFILDYFRSSRGYEESSLTLIKSLLTLFGCERVSILCYKNPISRRIETIYNINPKFGEILGVHHMKYLIFDDLVLLTGANLNQTYFENRVDRYILFKNANELAQYLKSLTENLGKVYYKITESGVIPPSSAILNIPKVSPSQIQCEDSDYVYIYPTLQISALNFKQDTLFSRIFYTFLPLIQEVNTRIVLCTSYFNVTEWMKKIILASESKWSILTSSPESNSFFNSEGFSSRIPFFYRFNLHSFVKQSRSTSNNVQAFEFYTENQTFHAKGLLIKLKDGGTLSTIGSPNFGYRSETRDNELQFYLFSKNTNFNTDLRKSFEKLFINGKRVDRIAKCSVSNQFWAKILKYFL